MSESTAGIMGEAQKQRWLKYGANTIAASLLVVVLTVLVVWVTSADFHIGGRRVRFRTTYDTTAAGLYSLKPQTLKLIRENKSPITIVSLYTRVRPSGEGAENPSEFAQTVADLLDEYQRRGNRIEVQVVDPVSQPYKVDQLIEKVTEKYGGEIEKYRKVVTDYKGVYEEINKLAEGEVNRFRTLTGEIVIEDRELARTLMLTGATIQDVPERLKEVQEDIEKWLKQKPPDFRSATNSINSGMSLMSRLLNKIITDFDRGKDDKKVPEALRKIMADGLPNYRRMKELADDMEKRCKELGELKLDDLRRSLQQKDVILVMGETDMRVISRDKVWQEIALGARADQLTGRNRYRFAGEQQITGAILAVQGGKDRKKTKVVFVRPGGQPLTNPGIPGFIEGGPFSRIAERLRDYNFEVQEKDLTGTWAMQAQMRGSFAPPEPSDEEIKDAIWVVLAASGRSMMGGPESIGAKVAEHLKAGRPALILALNAPRGDSLSEALDEWGVKIRTDLVAVHEELPPPQGRVTDPVENALRWPPIFVIKDYGDHPMVRPIRSLDGVLVPLVPIETTPKEGCVATKIIPVPTPKGIKVWGESNVEDALNPRTRRVEFNPPKPGEVGGDVPPPLFGGAVVERTSDGARLVVLGSAEFAMNHILEFNDLELEREGRFVSRFPGNSELFCNAIFWLAKMDTMIATSPAAMEMSRIKEMSAAADRFWRIVVLLVVLPLAVLVAGVLVFLSRRD